ncbi:MAG: HD domain-containing protein, partial [Patescibacteria group bacterium]
MTLNIGSNTDYSKLASLLEGERYSDEERALVKKAYTLAKKAHENQTRFTGEPYFNHSFATGIKLTQMLLPAEVIAAGLLHDVLEDADVTAEELEQQFGSD